jgi:hypothetical protein
MSADSHALAEKALVSVPYQARIRLQNFQALHIAYAPAQLVDLPARPCSQTA